MPAMLSRRCACLVALLSIFAIPRATQAAYPSPTEGDWIARDVRFSSGETLGEVRLHYRTLGTPVKDSAGRVRNAVLILHGTGGSGAQFADELYGPGQLLDVTRYYLVLPDNIGHGRSSKPSDGARMAFPRYTYDDMVALQHRLLTEGLGVDHLRLVIGTSMGGMHAWMWAYRYPDFADGLVALAAVPTAIVGRNRVWRRMLMDSIREDPAWKNGAYTEQPVLGLSGAARLSSIMGAAPLHWHTLLPTRDKADEFAASQVRSRLPAADANDMLYQFDASRDYDPSPHLARIVAPVLAINSADDQINPPELGLMERLMPQVRRGRFVLIPTSEKTRGHGTHTWAALYREELRAFIAATSRE